MAKNEGFIQLIIILVLVVVILSLLGVSLSALFQNRVLKDNFSFIGDILGTIWQSWAGKLAKTVWDFSYKFFIDFVWSAFTDAMEAIKSGRNPILEQ